MDSQKNDDAARCFSASMNGEIFEIFISGEYTMESLVTMKEKINDMAVAEKVKKMLVDVRDTKADIGYSETYLLAMMTPTYFDKIPTAIVHSPEHSHLARFYEDLINKNGIPMKFFTDIDDARKWLKNIRQKHQSFHLSK